MVLRLALAVLTLGSVTPAQDRPPVDFARDVEPILRASCVECHGSKKAKGKLRLDLKAPAMQGGTSGKSIVPGHSARSLLVERLLEKDADLRMPSEAPPLSPAQIETLRAWIDQGAPWPDAPGGAVVAKPHWAFVPPTLPSVPTVKDRAFVRNPVDAFVAAGHEKRGLRPRPPLDRPRLLRRVTLDLIGLPATPEEVRAFAADLSPDAFEKVVDRLLADPRYGERWARHWMDVWRYADADPSPLQTGLQVAPNMWRWRDWIIDSLNGDKGYDLMVQEMLAADELDPADLDDSLRATAYLARNKSSSRDAWLHDTVDHAAQAFLGVSLQCARCHDHPVDPISQVEYYQVRAIFEPHAVRSDPFPGTDGLTRAYDGNLNRATYRYVRGIEQKPDTARPLAPGVPSALRGPRFEVRAVELPLEAWAPHRHRSVIEAEREAGRAAMLAATKSLEAARDRDEVLCAQAAVDAAGMSYEALEAVLRAEERESDTAAREAAAAQRKAKMLEARYRVALAEVALARTPGDAARKAHTKARKDLEAAEAEAAKPATAQFTKRGRGDYPRTSTGRRLALARWITHLENPLAARVAVNHVWLRHFGQPLVGSVTDFGLGGQPPTDPALLDWLAVTFARGGWKLKTLHRLMATSSAYRMDSTSDAADAARDPDNRLLWRVPSRRMEAEVVRDSILFVSGRLDPTLKGPSIEPARDGAPARRSLYYRHSPYVQMAFLRTFDGPVFEESYRRAASVQPQQSLALLNSDLAIDSARVLADRLAGEGAAFVEAAFEAVLGRAPTPAERGVGAEFLRAQGARAKGNLVQALFNHHEFVTIR